MRKGWEYKKLGEVCTLISDGSHNPPKGIDHSLYRMISSQNVFDDNLQITEDNVRYITESDHLCENKRTKLQKDVVLLTIVGTIGRSCVLKGNEGCLTLQRSVAALHPSDQIMPRYLMHCLIGNRHTLNQEAHGIAQKGIYLKQLSSLSIPLPPKSTQLAIVSELDKINELIRLKKEQLKDFDNLAQSLFYEMFGDPVENEMGWNKMKWKDVLTIINGKNQSAVVDENGDYPIYGSGGIMGYANNWLCPEKCTIIGRKGNINKPIFVESKFWNVDTAFGLKPNIEILSPRFLFYFCLNYNFERHNKAVTIPSLTKADLLKIDIPLPPLPLQRLFAQRIEQIEREKSEVQKSIQDLETLLASRMQYWFE